MGNSHHAAALKHPGGVDTEIPEPKSPTNEDMLPMGGESEQSVLQAKLTNMAIQVLHTVTYPTFATNLSNYPLRHLFFSSE